MFPTIELSLEDVESSWAGLRPLIFEEGKSASELSRKDEIFYSDSKLISIAGGKLTGYRKMSQRVVDMVARKFKKRFDIEFGEIRTDKTPLTEKAFANYKEVKTYSKQLTKQVENLGLSKAQVSYLVHNYGKQTDVILANVDLQQGSSSTEALILAELEFCLQQEMVLTPLDFYLRRTGRVFFDIKSVHETKEAVLDTFTTYFTWSPERRKLQAEALEACLHGSTQFV